jgi:porphobilinogen deaminase
MAQNSEIKPSILLGSATHETQLWLDIHAEQQLSAAGIAAKTNHFDTQEAAFRAVLAGEIGAFVCPLHQAPTTLPLGLVITAVTQREDARTLMFALPQDETLFSAANPRKVLTDSDINRAQMQYLYPEDRVEQLDLSLDESIKLLKIGVYDALILGQSDANPIAFLNVPATFQTFSVREFVPLAGQGVVCFITAEDDLATRRLLQTVHRSAVSAVTNIERMVQKMLKNRDVCVHCERDRMGNYHLWAAALVDNRLSKTRVSQSTSFGMAEKVVAQLLSA